MTLSRVTARFGLVAAAAALMLTLGLATAGTTQAQVLPAVVYGQGLTAGQEVSAFIGGTLCGSTDVNADGEWTMNIASNAPCDPDAGDSITFTVDGKAATASPAAVWNSGGTPSDVANGYKLTVVQATATPTRTATPPPATSTPTAAATATATPAPPKTGNAGLLGEDGGNGGLWLLLGLAAVAGAAVAGRELYSRR